MDSQGQTAAQLTFREEIAKVKVDIQSAQNVRSSFNFKHLQDTTYCDKLSALPRTSDGVSTLKSILKDRYGIDQSCLHNVDSILYCEERSVSVAQFSYGANTGGDWKFGILVLCRDGDSIESFLGLNKSSFSFHPIEHHYKKVKRALGVVTGVRRWVEYSNKTLSADEMETLKNYFRYKTLLGFHEKGYVTSLDRNAVGSVAQATQANIAIQ